MKSNTYKRWLPAMNIETARRVIYKRSEVAYLEACKPEGKQDQELISEAIQLVKMLELFLESKGAWPVSPIISEG
jgi:hypothetical protein